MSITPHEPYVFGSHVANLGDAQARGSTSPQARTATAIREVAADHELHILCTRVAEALPATARTAVVLVDPRRPPATPEELTAAAIATSSPSTSAVLRIEWLLREGPVRTSLESGETTVSSRLGADGRWPRFARAVPAHDTVSAAAIPIPLAAGAGSGALVAYSHVEDASTPVT